MHFPKDYGALSGYPRFSGYGTSQLSKLRSSVMVKGAAIRK